MHSKILIFFILFLNLSLILLEAKWCSTMVPVWKTRSKLVTRYRYVTWRNWLGMNRGRNEPYVATEIESYHTSEQQSVCCTGYTQMGNSCTPKCTPPCPENSYCSEPNICKCNGGYSSSFSWPSLTDCKPICSGGCPEHSKCSSPERCVCDDGYKMAAEPLSECIPQCINGCPVNGYCQQPNMCACRTGYTATEDNQCQPVCSKGCPTNSKCVQPEECACVDGYTMAEDLAQCQPICSETCPEHSICYGPNQCLCNKGYLLQHQASGRGLFCKPVCSPNCWGNGKCVAPDVCECFSGYELTHSNITDPKVPLCQPKCSKGCAHGICFAPEVCVCNPNYLMGPQGNCEPTCSLGCVNGKCVDPEVCACATGYRFAANSVHICEPQCEPECVNAECAAPNLCICWHNYEPKEMMVIGATNEQNVCVPSCNSQCFNGFCSAPNTCSCLDGYALHVAVENECVPQCAEDCVHGDCVAPGICACWPGYELNTYEGSGSGSNGRELCIWSESTTEYFSTAPSVSSDNTDFSTLQTFEFMLETLEPTTEPYEFSSYSDTTEHNFDISSTSASSSTTDSTLFEVLSTAELCNSQCKCWQRVQATDEFRSSVPSKCLHICLDAFDKPCLDLGTCICDTQKLQLLCNHTDSWLEEFESEIETESRYICKIRFNAALTNEVSSSVQKTTKEKNEIPWAIIAACITISSIAAVILFISFRKCMQQRGNDYIVNYQS